MSGFSFMGCGRIVDSCAPLRRIRQVRAAYAGEYRAEVWFGVILMGEIMKSIVTLFILYVLSTSVEAAQSVCHGTPAHGRIEHAVPLPENAGNFRAYSRAGVALGRTYTHTRVVDAITDAYAALARSAPDKIFVYGETGFEKGGPFKPHRTHQNGLSVDFMVPVVDAKGRSVPLPGRAANRYGYDIEFDANARYRDLRIDFEAMGEHLYALDRAGRRSGAPIDRVIFEPAFLPKLFATRRGPFLRDRIAFVRGKVWWRHDEHYHVDFAVPCRPR
jgi:penicillin-insensitive murein DD-endopeptidase